MRHDSVHRSTSAILADTWLELPIQNKRLGLDFESSETVLGIRLHVAYQSTTVRRFRAHPPFCCRSAAESTLVPGIHREGV